MTALTPTLAERERPPEYEAAMAEWRGRIALRLLEEQIRREREWRHPVNVALRGLHGLWRSVVTGGWE